MQQNIQLDETDKHILFELEKNCRIADVKLAKIVKKSKDAVRYRITRMENAKIITDYKTWIDPFKFGYTSATIYLTCKILPQRKQQLIDEILENAKSYWIGVAEGAWNIAVSYFIKNNEELYQIKQHLLSKYSDLILNISLTSVVGVSVHEKTFLLNKQSKLITFSQKTEFLRVDALSKKILEILYTNATENIATIAAKLKTTVDKVKQRMDKMESQQIIIKYAATIDYHKLGYEYYKAFVYLKDASSQQITAMYRYFEQSTTIINVVKQLAAWDLEIIIFARNFAEYESSIAQFTKKFETAVQKIETATMGTDILYPCNTPLLE